MNFKVPGMDYQPTGGDKSIELLRSLFGGTVDGVGGSLGPLSDVLFIFNGAILALASVLGFILVAQAVVGTAHDGSVLGKRFSSMWVPIRTVGAAALLVPAVGGFSSIQLLVLSLAVQGVGLADRMTNAGVDAVFSKGLVQPAVVATKTGEELSKGLIQIAACMSVNEKLNADAGLSIPSYTDAKRTPKGAVAVNIGLDYTSTFGSGRGNVRHSCGSFTVAKTASDSPRFASAADELQAAQVEAAMAMYRSSKQATDSIVAMNGTATDFAPIRAAMVKAHDDALGAALESAMRKAMAAGSAEHQKTIQQIKQEGWLGLGGASFKLASISSEMSANVKLGSVEASPDSRAAFSISEGDYRAEVAAVINRVNVNADSKVPQANPDAGDKGWFKGLTQKLVQEAVDLVTEGPFNAIKSFTTSGSGNPLLDVKAQGDTLLNVGVATGLAAMLLAIPAAAFGASMVVLAIAFPIVMLLVTLGATMAIWIPMIPYITFISVAVAWLVMLVESVVAAGVWLLLWFSGEKDGIVAPGGEQGVRFLASVLLMPALTVIAFFAASIIIIALGAWISSTFSGVVRSMNSTSLSAVVMVLGYCVLYVATMISLISKVYGMCLTMPATVLKWIGGGFTGAESIEKGIESQNNAIIAPITSFTSNAAPKRAGHRVGGGQGAGSAQGTGEDQSKGAKPGGRPRVTNEPE